MGFKINTNKTVNMVFNAKRGKRHIENSTYTWKEFKIKTDLIVRLFVMILDVN